MEIRPIRAISFGFAPRVPQRSVDSAPVVILSAAAAASTENIRLTSAVTVLSASDPVRVFQEFATLDRHSEHWCKRTDPLVDGSF